MTVEEMRAAIKAECKKHRPLCTDGGECPLYCCIGMGERCDGKTQKETTRNYKLMFGINEPVSNTDIVNHPTHYNREGAMESIDEMVAVFGKDAVKYFCLCNVWKYRYRAADKNGMEDMKKSDWYMRKYKELDNLG